MNLLKKPFGLTLQALLWVMIFGCLLAHPFTNATSSPPGDKRDYVLIINSYNESSSWGWEIITDITARIEQIENLEVYVEHMNTLLMDQQSDLDNFRTNLSREYGKNPPRMLIYIGAPAFIMRDFAEKEWGKGIPSIICAEEDFIGPDKYYVSKRAIPHSERIPLRELSGEYNLTLLYAPIYLEQTIELMRRMIPEMNRLVFVRDGRYINQQYEDELRKLLDTDYPGMRFTSYKASNMSVDQLLDSLNVTDTRHTGVLFSSWHYTRNIAGNTEITANPFKIIASSTAPLFALWPSSVKNSGVVGGFTYDVSVYNRQIIKTFNTILEGRQPRDIPFYTPTDAHPTFNYPAMLRNKISPEICPPDSVFIDKPETFAERNRTAIIPRRSTPFWRDASRATFRSTPRPTHTRRSTIRRCCATRFHPKYVPRIRYSSTNRRHSRSGTERRSSYAAVSSCCSSSSSNGASASCERSKRPADGNRKAR